MKLYKCNLCFKEFKQKCHLEEHLKKKKKPCKKNKVNIQPNILTENPQNSTKITKIPQKSTNFPQNLTIFPQNSTIFSQNIQDHKEEINIPNLNNEIIQDDKIKNKNYKCPYCEKLYSRTDSLTRHIGEFCKNKKHFDNLNIIKNKMNNNIPNEKYVKLIEDNKKLIRMLEEYEVILKENNLLKNTIPSVINNNNTNNNTNNTNNGSINNGVVNNGSINSGNIINIVQFGKEDIGKCDLIEMMNIYLKSTGGNIFPNILKYINFNPNHPENFNILMSDLSRENVKIHDGKKFITKKFKNVKDDILNVLSKHITNMCDSYIENPKIKKNNDVLSKIKINDISVKLITNDDITPLLRTKKDKNKLTSENSEISEESDIDDLDDEQEKKLVFYEKKRVGLQEITINKLKDELYNNRDMVLNVE